MSVLGLESGTVRVDPYSPKWPACFRREAERIHEAIAPLPLRIEHMGSTAVPGLPAKPIVDIAAGYPTGAAVGGYIEALVRAGYVHRGEQGIPGREFFRLGNPRAYHIHLAVEDGRFWREHLAFRDYLRANPAARDAYGALKLALAVRHPHDRETYIDAKGPFVLAVLTLAGHPRETSQGLEIVVEGPASLADLACIPIAFQVDRVLVVDDRDGEGDVVLAERSLDLPYVKDYDREPGNSPTDWAARLDLANSGFIAAYSNGKRIGGAVITFKTEGVTMLEGRTGLAVLWDIRVAPDARRRGVGGALFRTAQAWAISRGCRQLKIETQTINVPAWRFYARQGCTLGEVNRSAYPDFPNEVQLIWYKNLVGGCEDAFKSV